MQYVKMRNYLCSIKLFPALTKRKSAILELVWIWLAISEKLSYEFEIKSYVMIPFSCKYQRQGLDPIRIILFVKCDLDRYFFLPNQLNHINIKMK